MKRTLGITLAYLVVIFAGAFWAFPKLITGDYADVTITKINVQPNGQVNLSLTTTSSSGTQIVTAFYYGDRYMGGGKSRGGGIFGRPGHGSSGLSFTLHPDGPSWSGKAEDAPWYSRLLIHEGEKRHLRGGERLYFYDFQTSKGVRYDGYFEVEAKSS